ncbi:hypothetical protein JCM6882_001438 [Rhodosporidiobolus microsporus]
MSRPLLQEHPPPSLALHPLPPPTRSLLRSSTILPSLPALLSELAQNAIDAHATRITASIDLDTWTIRVDDNGAGFAPAGVTQLAAHTRYTTSKLPNEGAGTSADALLSGVETYGFRGEALASIADVATLEIRSTCAATGEASELVLRDGVVLKLVTGAEKAAAAQRGTTVWARDIFYKLPVRRRPLTKPSAHSALLSSLRTTLSTLALAHPSIAFSLSDTTTSSAAAGSTGEAKTLLHLSRASEGLVGRWKQLWGRAGVEKVWEFDEAEMGEHSSGVRAKGFFSLSAAHSKAGQYIFVNARPLSPISSPLHKLLNTLITTSSFARHASSHLSFSPSPARAGRPASPAASPAPAAPLATATRQSPKKAAERHPVFVVCLEVPGAWVDVTLEPEKKVVEFVDPKRVEAFLTALTKRFLVENGFATPAAVPVAPAPSEKATPKKRGVREASVGEGGRTKRVAIELDGDNLDSAAVQRPPSSSRPPPRIVVPAPPPTADPFAPTSITSTIAAAASSSYTRWTDPSTLQTFLIDPRTGNSWREGTRPDHELVLREEGEDGCEGCGGRKRGGGGGGIVERGWLKRRRDEGAGEEGDDGEGEEMPEWLRGTLESWQNSVFPSLPRSAVGAARIPALPALPPNALAASTATGSAPTLASAFSSSKAGLARGRAGSQAQGKAQALPALTHGRVKAMTEFFTTSAASAASAASPSAPLEPAALLPLSTTSSSAAATPGAAPPPGRLTRPALARAEFIAQVDNKFLLFRVPPPPLRSSSSAEGAGAGAGAGERGVGGTLVLVDQHAASERVRVERFWAQLAASDAPTEVEVKELDESARVGVVVGREEARDVQAWEGEFARWGVRFAPFSVPPPPSPPAPGAAAAAEEGAAAASAGDYVQLFLSAVPALLAARLTTEPRTAQELVRSFVAQLRERGAGGGAGAGAGVGGGGEDGGASWVARVKDAPPVLVELVNSKACRGAVMFNDALTPAQSTALLRALAATKFPFQCAHGRPSMIPLVELAPPSPPPPPSAQGKGKKGRGKAPVVDWERFA